MTDGQRILYIRKLMKMSQQEFAMLLSISQAALSDIENGKNGISYPVFKQLVEKIGVHPYWFMWGQDPVFRDNTFAEKYHISHNSENLETGHSIKLATGNNLKHSKTNLDTVMKLLIELQEQISELRFEKRRHKK